MAPHHALPPASHDHVFLGASHRRNERKVWLVIALTASMMLVEIIAGTLYGSMALVADGWHMSTHAGAMLIAALAYGYARRHARDSRFTFGTGKLGDLAAFASAIVLAMVSLLIGWESAVRLADPVAIRFDEAIGIAVVGLAVNLISAWLLKDVTDHHHHAHAGGHRHDHAHGRDDHGHAQQDTRDNNLRSAYMHVLADALTSVLAIVALLLGRSYGWYWADPVMGIAGALVIANWSWALVRNTGGALLDQVPGDGELAGRIRSAIEDTGARITDLHVWRVGPGHHAVIVSVSADHPLAPSAYKSRLAHLAGLSHVTIEVEPAQPLAA